MVQNSWHFPQIVRYVKYGNAFVSYGRLMLVREVRSFRRTPINMAVTMNEIISDCAYRLFTDCEFTSEKIIKCEQIGRWEQDIEFWIACCGCDKTHLWWHAHIRFNSSANIYPRKVVVFLFVLSFVSRVAATFCLIDSIHLPTKVIILASSIYARHDGIAIANHFYVI